MPKYGIHHIVIDKTIKKIIEDSAPASGERDIASLIEDNKEWANLGGIGPDVFFWAPDYKEIDKLYTLYENLKSIIDIYNKIVEPVRRIKDAVGDAVEETVGALAPSTVELIKTTLNEIKETGELLKASIATGLFAGVIGIGDLFAETFKMPALTHTLFNSFAPPLQKQLNLEQPLNESQWYWFDMLHYRHTGPFANQLLNNSGSATQKAYTFGYLSHIATDVVGHAFVNQVVGGPYRMNVQKHVMVENYMDTWAFNSYFEETISKTLLTRMELPDPNNLPNAMVDMLDNSFRTTFANLYPILLRDPGFMTKDEIRTTYRRFHEILTMMNGFYIDRPEEPFSNVADILQQALDDLLEAPPSPPSPDPDLQTCSWGDIFSFGLTSDSRDCYEDFFKEASKYFQYLGELLYWTLETMLDLIDLLLASLLSLPIMFLLAILYGIQLLAHEILQKAKALLAEAGFIYPEPELINTSLGISSVTTLLNCSPAFKYPKVKEATVSHFVCPLSQAENPTTAADFNEAVNSIFPDTFIEKVEFNLNNLTAYANATNPGSTRDYHHSEKRIGNATDFSKWLILNSANNDTSTATQDIVFADWNLDSDRGYGYKNWRGLFDMDEFGFESEDFV